MNNLEFENQRNFSVRGKGGRVYGRAVTAPIFVVETQIII